MRCLIDIKRTLQVKLEAPTYILDVRAMRNQYGHFTQRILRGDIDFADVKQKGRFRVTVMISLEPLLGRRPERLTVYLDFTLLGGNLSLATTTTVVVSTRKPCAHCSAIVSK